jgi:hypothetical protein
LVEAVQDQKNVADQTRVHKLSQAMYEQRCSECGKSGGDALTCQCSREVTRRVETQINSFLIFFGLHSMKSLRVGNLDIPMSYL